MGLVRTLFFGGWSATGFLYEELVKRRVFTRARETADRLNLPLVNYGCKYMRYMIERSDYNVDIVPRKGVPRFVLTSPDSVGRLPFGDKSVVIYCSHVLEHVDNPEHLLEEFNRISDHVFTVLPNPLFPQAWLDPDHERVYVGDRVIERPRWLGPLLIGLNLVSM